MWDIFNIIMEKSFCVLMVFKSNFPVYVMERVFVEQAIFENRIWKLETIKETRKDNGQGLRDKSIKKMF